MNVSLGIERDGNEHEAGGGRRCLRSVNGAGVCGSAPKYEDGPQRILDAVGNHGEACFARAPQEQYDYARTLSGLDPQASCGDPQTGGGEIHRVAASGTTRRVETATCGHGDSRHRNAIISTCLVSTRRTKEHASAKASHSA